jgi:hypothetical protein
MDFEHGGDEKVSSNIDYSWLDLLGVTGQIVTHSFKKFRGVYLFTVNT